MPRDLDRFARFRGAGRETRVSSYPNLWIFIYIYIYILTVAWPRCTQVLEMGAHMLGLLRALGGALDARQSLGGGAASLRLSTLGFSLFSRNFFSLSYEIQSESLCGFTVAFEA